MNINVILDRVKESLSFIRVKSKLLVTILLILGVVGYYFIVIPTLNLSDIEGYTFVLSLLVILLFYFAIFHTSLIDKLQKGLIILVGLFVLLGGVIYAYTSPIFHASSYAQRINVEEVNFSNDTISEVDFNKTPILDRDSSMKLGDKVMGEMPELVSQFEVSEEYTQISYKNSVYRVTPLEYAGFFKYMSNKDEGIPGYILVNSTNGKAQLVKLKDLGLDGMKYVPSGYFFDNLQRKLQLEHPFTIFGSPSFEIDETGHPYYVCTTYGYYGIGHKKYVSGMILFDPISGESTHYDVGHFPEWVDRVYPESLVIEEINDNGTLKDGFINSIIGQKNVTITSEGYNYLEKDGDIWIYSGITSANNDSSNLAFVLTNLRTHETLKFACSGANELSAMESAEGEVKNYGYNATFPLLVNVNGNPVYLLSLKDNAGLVKMYAMVDAKDFQKVTVISADNYNLSKLKKQYINDLGDEDISTDNLKNTKITIKDYKIITIDNKSKIFITDTKNNQYKSDITSSNENIYAFIKKGDSITISYLENEDVSIIKEVSK